MRGKILLGLAVGFLVGCLTVSLAFATTIEESGDAGSSLVNAQMLPGGTDVVTGNIEAGDVVDMFGFGWGGGAFSANTIGTVFDSQLFLFSSDGTGIQANDDAFYAGGPANLQLSSLAAGTYYLGVSQWDHDPYDTNGQLMFPSYPYNGRYGPQTKAPLSYWGGKSTGDGGAYTINFESVTPYGDIIATNPTGDPKTAPVPEPSTVLLFGSGLIVLSGGARRKMKK